MWQFLKRFSPPNENDGAEAHRQAKVDLADARSKWPEVSRTAKSLRELRQRNHFAEQISLIFHGSPE